MSGGDRYRWSLAPSRESYEPFLKNLNRTFKENGETIYQGRNVLKKITWRDKAVIVKSFAVPNQLNQYIYGSIRKSKSRRAFENSIELAKRGINTPLPIGYIEYRYGRRLGESFYAYYMWPADFTARQVIINPQSLNRTVFLSAIGQFAWQLHKNQVNFMDFSPGNILIRQGEAVEFCLVDTNRVRFEPLSLRKRMQTFARLWADDEDLVEIVAGYVTVSGDDGLEATKLALYFSQRHKRQALRKEAIKTLLRLH